ncbi:hypothetical protein GM415_06005 [Pseudodesulfovibrio cashew]|uniref:Uncharacterized protein n=1 Tax=Pseudodesulfovibrio cashew TaxID=2678688 RepID=A0A6I6JEU1_9BACT|nr:hypothetical protein [Pseudodesulfovibrio cashew]QGY39689.1 hypothetical protein GM415_06005 [Pseudodesulfovibrio cashew]
MTKTTNATADWRMTMPEEWTVKQLAEDGSEVEIPLREHPALRDYKTKDEAVKALVHAQRMLGKTPEGYVRMPGKDDGPEQVAAFYAALGRPEAPDGYALPEIDLPDGFEVQEAMLEGFRSIAFDLGLTPEQVAGLYQWFLPLVLDTHAGLEAEARQLKDSELESLRAVHRGETPRMLDNALRTAEVLGGKDLLHALDQTRAGDRAAVIAAFAKMAPLVLESGMRTSGSGWGEELSREKLREMMQDPRYHDPLKRDPEFVAKIRKGFEQLYPGDYIPGSRL